MAKRKVARKNATANKPSGASPVKLSEKDKRTATSIRSLADGVEAAANRTRDLHVEIPSRNLSNVKYSARKRIIEMGSNKNRRELFNLSQAKSYMQTMLVASGCHDLIQEGKTTSIRGLYYKMKHTIAGTKENTFEEQNESDPIIEDVEVLLNALREELHLYAQKKGEMVGDITIVSIARDKRYEIDCSQMGMGGYGIPSIVEPDVFEFKTCEAKFVLHVEKDTVWQRFNEDEFWLKHNCILTHGGGQPTRGVRRLLNRLHNELNLPVYCLLDND
ncbi:MAG: DNA topoisomerase VI, partial [Gammaproteobacteria bacterium]|nr:DNA topoisomerase VI [Gammaproteobacteria bacterium]